MKNAVLASFISILLLLAAAVLILCLCWGEAGQFPSMC